MGRKFTIFDLVYFVFESKFHVQAPSGAYIRRGLCTEGNLRFKIDWASLIVGSKFAVLLCFTLYVRAIFQVQAPGGLIFGGAI